EDLIGRDVWDGVYREFGKRVEAYGDHEDRGEDDEEVELESSGDELSHYSSPRSLPATMDFRWNAPCVTIFSPSRRPFVISICSLTVLPAETCRISKCVSSFWTKTTLAPSTCCRAETGMAMASRSKVVGMR